MKQVVLWALTMGVLGHAYSSAAAASPGALALRPCTATDLKGFLCGTLRVPENRMAPKARSIPLNIILLPAQTQSTQPPLFSLAGGPGMAATDDAGFMATGGRIYWRSRDVVLVDQRGTGRSGPLRCPALEGRHRLQQMYPADEVRACRNELEKQHDLTQYSTVAAAHDLEAVRRALGYPTIDLMGLSYGTRLAQVYARLYPQRVRAMALLGSVPMDRRVPLDHASNGHAVLDSVFAACATDRDCGAAFPDLRKQWARVLARIERGPIYARYEREGKTQQIELQRGPFAEAMRALLLTTGGQRSVPYLIHRMAADDFGPFLETVLTPGAGDIAEGLYLSVVCGEDTNRINAEDIDARTHGTFPGRYRVDQQIGACREWPASSAPVLELDATRSDMPVLLMAGALDYVTPVEWAQTVARVFTRSRVVRVPALGHFPIGLSNMECYDETIAAFFAQGNAESLDLSCIDRMLPPPFRRS